MGQKIQNIDAARHSVCNASPRKQLGLSTATRLQSVNSFLLIKIDVLLLCVCVGVDVCVGVGVCVCINAMPECPASDPSGTGMNKTNDAETSPVPD